MKLLLCPKCSDVRAVRRKPTSCECGNVTARYIDNLNCEWNGEGFLLGFANHSLITALRSQQNEGDHPDGMGRNFTAFVIPRSGPSVKIKR